jgi:hypothetical protein
MDMLKKYLEPREKSELIAIIQHMVRQEPDALTHKAAWSSGEKHKALLAALERTN